MSQATDSKHADTSQCPRSLVPYRWELLALLWVAFLLNQADRQVYSVVLKSIQADLHLSDAELGLVASILFWTLALFFPVAGYLGDVLSKKWIITCSLLFWSVATLSTGFSLSAWHLVALRSLATGGGEAFYAPPAFALIAQFHRKTRALAMSIHQTAVYLGFVLAGLVGGYISQTWGWRAAFYAFGSFGIAMAGVLAVRLRSGPAAEDDLPQAAEPAAPPNARADASGAVSPWRTLTVLLVTPTALLLSVAFAGMIFVHLAYLTWSPTFMQEKFGLTELQAGFSSMFYFQAAAFMGTLAGGWCSDRWVARRRTVRMEIQIVGLAASAPMIVLFAVGNTVGLACVGLAGFGLFRGLYDANIYASLFDVIPPRYRASANGMMSTLGFLFGAASPYLLGRIKPTVGLSLGLAGLALVHLAAAAAILLAQQGFFAHDYFDESADGPSGD